MDKIQFQVSLKIAPDPLARELVLACLQAQGVDLQKVVEQEDRSGHLISFFFDSRVLADRMAVRLRGLKIHGTRVFRKTHHKSDWSARWKKGWRPFPLTDRFQVIPLWQENRRCPRGKDPIFLNTTNAFGTGRHETTRFTAQLIERLHGQFCSFLDVGTGTGILAIVALKCGASRVEAFDIDSAAVIVAKDNLKANGLSCSVKKADVQTFHPRRPFDLVAANLVSPDLIEFRKHIVTLVKPGGQLIISGISLPNVGRVRRAFAGVGFKLLERRQGAEWAAMLLRSGRG